MKKNEFSKLVRVQKAIALFTQYSRRKAEELIIQGRVKVNEEIATPGQLVDLTKDKILLDGKPLIFDLQTHYLILNKPTGFVCTSSDEYGRETIFSLLKGFFGSRLFIVGRLDKNSEGLLLLTNDGDLAYRIMHPRFELEKEYLVEISGVPSRKIVAKIEKGVELEEGKTAPTKISILKQETGKATLKMTLKEGKKREIRRVWQKFGFSVLSLKRVRIGPIFLGNLKPGKWRKLSQREVIALRRAVGLR